MTKIDEYKTALQQMENWDAYLLENSNLPGPRANLELLYAAAEVGEEKQFLAYCTLPKEGADGNSPRVFLVCCGVMGLGKLIGAGQTAYWQTLRAFASDDRWRVREAVAMALQIVGDAHIQQLLDEMQRWKTGNLCEQRAVVAGLCEPRLLKQKEVTGQVLQILDEITASISQVENRKGEAFDVLKKGLSYGWSVAVAACPEEGKPRMERWVGSQDKDIARIMKENLTKNRLVRMDEAWVREQQGRLARLNHGG